MQDTISFPSDKRQAISPKPFRESWSIGIYKGTSPFDLSNANNIENPVLTRHEVTDLNASFVADPFLLFAKGKYHLFMEVKGIDTRKGVIGLACSEDGIKWTYEQVVLEESYHLSYPYVFEEAGEYYMIPEGLEANAVRLYKASSFPYEWEPCKDLISGEHADPSIFYHDNRWWMFTCPNPFKHDRLNLYHSDHLLGPWQAHPSNPIVDHDATKARPAGRILFYDGNWIRYAQDCEPFYGRQVNAFKIEKLTTTDYQETAFEENPIIKFSGKGWNGQRMHHIDAHECKDGSWMACVDGYFFNEPKEE